jgi:hypothetical protein
VTQQTQLEQQRRYQQRRSEWDRRSNEQQRIASQRERLLQQQRRMNQYRFQRLYWERLRQDRLRLQSQRQWAYSPYIYRYYRGGRYYQANQYGADMLRRALNLGYQEGWRAGQADREDRWRFNYQDSFAYQDATYGYDGYYVDLFEYQYYFREGFRRGYEDGFYSRYQYGTYSNGVYNLIGSVLNAILNLQRYD